MNTVVKKRTNSKVSISEFSATAVKSDAKNTANLNDNANKQPNTNSLINPDDRLIPHSPEANCSLTKNNQGKLHFIASRNIAAGEQLTCHYISDEPTASCLQDTEESPDSSQPNEH